MRMSDWRSDVFSSDLREACGIAELARPYAPDLGGEFLDDLVAKPESQLEVGKPRSDARFGDILSREIDLCPRLQDQPLGDALVIIAFEPPEQIALVRQEQRAFGFEPVRRESFEADRRIAAEIGTASGRERVCQSVYISVVAVS